MQPACHISLRQARRSRVLPWALALSLHLAVFVFLANCTLATKPVSDGAPAMVTLKLPAQSDLTPEAVRPPLELPEIVETAAFIEADRDALCDAIARTPLESAAPARLADLSNTAQDAVFFAAFDSSTSFVPLSADFGRIAPAPARHSSADLSSAHAPVAVNAQPLATPPRDPARHSAGPHAGSASPASPRKMSHGPYPEGARRLGLEGTVTLGLEVLASGKVGSVEIAQSSGHQVLDRAATKTAREWIFNPAQSDGRAITSRIEIRYNFKLLEQR